MTRAEIYESVKDVIVRIGHAGISKSQIRQKDKLARYVGQGNLPGLAGPVASKISTKLRTALYNAFSGDEIKTVGDLVGWLDSRLNPPEN